MTDSDVLDIAGLIHTRWSNAFEALRTVRAETDDGSPDWGIFHFDRFNAAQASETYWAGVKSRFMEENRAVFKAMLGE